MVSSIKMSKMHITAFVALALVCMYPASAVEPQHNMWPVESDILDNVPADADLHPMPDMEAWQDVLLPADLKPLHYVLELHPDLSENGSFKFAGRVEMTVQVKNSTDKVVLHAHNDIDIHSASVVLQGTSDHIHMISINRSDVIREFTVLQLDRQLQTGTNYTVTLNYTGVLNDEMRGFYRSSYVNSNGQKRWLAATHFEPTAARRAYPCMDEPNLKATFDVTLIRDASRTSISNMPLRETINRGDGFFADVYQTMVPCSTYLVAFVVSDFVSEGSRKFRVWSRPDAINQTGYGLDAGIRIQAHFGEVFQIPYALQKQDMVALPDFGAGAMENWGLITYREMALLYHDKYSTAINKLRATGTISHELAHQWFGNLVTAAWWSDLWLNEGFAAYVESIGTDHLHPDWKMWEQFVPNKLQMVMDRDSRSSSRPIVRPVAFPGTEGIFSPITYQKGASILRMIEHFLSTPVFRNGLASYLKAFAYSNAWTDDLWHHLTKAANNGSTNAGFWNMKAIMDTWVLKPGYPLVSVRRDYDDQEATLTQERFFTQRNQSQGRETRWHIPISYTTQNFKDFDHTLPRAWMNPVNDSVILPHTGNQSEWLILNLQETSFYRVNYDLLNWQLLIEQLYDNHTSIHSSNRAQLIDDVFSLARGGVVSYGLAFNLSRYLLFERNHVPWISGLVNLGYIKSQLQEKPVFLKFKNFYLNLLLPVYNMLGFYPDLSDNVPTILNRANILSAVCNLDHWHCLEQTKFLFRLWTTHQELKKPNKELLHLVACNGLKQSFNDSDWLFVWANYLESNVAAEKMGFLGALACTRQPYLLTRLLEDARNGSNGIRKQDVSFVIYWVSSNPLGRYLVMKFLQDHWLDLGAEEFGRKLLKQMIASLSLQLNTENAKQMMINLYNKNKHQLTFAAKAFDNTIQDIQLNINWVQDFTEEITAFLEKYH